MPDLAEPTLRIIRERYTYVDPTFASEKFAGNHEQYLAKESALKPMTSAGL